MCHLMGTLHTAILLPCGFIDLLVAQAAEGRWEEVPSASGASKAAGGDLEEAGALRVSPNCTEEVCLWAILQYCCHGYPSYQALLFSSPMAMPPNRPSSHSIKWIQDWSMR